MDDYLFGGKRKNTLGGFLGDALKLGDRAVHAMENRLLQDVVEAKPSSSGEVEKLTVEQFDNHVYFYADVDSDRCLAMLRNVREVDSRLRNERITRQVPDDMPHTPIWLHVHSSGGDIFAGLAAADQLAAIRTPVYSVVEGKCASAATLLSLACHRRFVTPSSFMLIHQLSSMMWGTHEEFKDEMEIQEMLMAKLVEFYTARTKMKAAQVRKLLKRDSWFGAEKCLELGLADEVAG